MGGFELVVDFKAADVREELYRRAERMERRISALGLGADGVHWPEGTALDTAKYYAKELGLGNPEVAREVLDVLVDETEPQLAQFWASPLGRVLFMCGLYPGAEVDRPTAQAILGASRQRVYQLVKDHTLSESMGLMISVESVRALMRRV